MRSFWWPVSFGDLKPAYGEIAVGLSCPCDATMEQPGTSDLSMMFMPREKKSAFVCSQVTVWLGDWATFEIKHSPGVFQQQLPRPRFQCPGEQSPLL